jgi:hypothetical protein
MYVVVRDWLTHSYHSSLPHGPPTEVSQSDNEPDRWQEPADDHVYSSSSVRGWHRAQGCRAVPVQVGRAVKLVARDCLVTPANLPLTMAPVHTMASSQLSQLLWKCKRIFLRGSLLIYGATHQLLRFPLQQPYEDAEDVREAIVIPTPGSTPPNTNMGCLFVAQCVEFQSFIYRSNAAFLAIM